MVPMMLACIAAIVVLSLLALLLGGLSGLMTLFGLIFLAILGLYLIGRYGFTDNRRPDEIHFAKTADGQEIAVWRYRPRGAAAQKTPVVLQHGLGANQRDLDLEDKNSLALFLAREGYDCYLPALRGCGPSAYTRLGHPDRWNIVFDQFVDYDLPAVFAKIQELTGATQVHYIGHSMGGMIGYALAEGENAARLKSLTSIAGPCFFENMQHFKPLLRYRFLFKPFPVIYQKVFCYLLAPLVYFWPKVAGREMLNPDNVTGPTLALGSANVIDEMPKPLLLQFGQWVEDGDFGSHHQPSWESRLAEITTPIYCIAGSLDYFCPPPAIDRVVDRVGSARKRYHLFAKANGDTVDYGHGDLSIGNDAPRDIFPTILSWLKEND
ncbi:MAG: alpha/beta hydrolase [Myxococcales bacterium]|nr:alpha/beta hydrolase [Myxococcales bacterium]